MITKVINVNLHQPIYERLTAKQGDIASRYLLFHLLDGDKPFDLSNKNVRVYAIKPDKTEIFNDLTINDASKGYCTLELTSQCLASAGIVKMELYISESGKVLTSIPFELEVIACINTVNSVTSTNEFSALEVALSSLQDYDNLRSEIIQARKGYGTVGKRLDNFDSQLDNLKYANKKFIAHKGFVALAPENTMKAVEKACENGFSMVEMDVTMSKDYKYVLMHDGTIDRTTNGTGGVYTYTLDELKQFKIDTGVMDSDEIIKIPTFEECVAICGNYGVGINVDASKPDIPYAENNFRYFIQLLKDNNIFEKSCIATESKTKRLEVMKVDKNTTLLWVSTLDKLVEDMQESWNYKNVIIGYNSTAEIPTKEQIKIIHDNGVRILMYGVNNYEKYLKLKNLNIDYIETETIYPNGGC